MARSYIVWSLCSVLAALVSGWMLWRAVDRQRRNDPELVWLWIALLAYDPAHTALMLGQVTFVTMIPVVGAWAAARRGLDRITGILLGLAVHVKLFVALLVVFFAVRRRLRVVAWMTGSIAVIVVMTLPLVGMRS